RTTARMAAFIPGASPPAVRIAIRRGREPVRSEDSLLPFMELGSDGRVAPLSRLPSGTGRANLSRNSAGASGAGQGSREACMRSSAALAPSVASLTVGLLLSAAIL